MTKRWHIDDRPTAVQFHQIATALRDGSVVLMPTDTIYGLHARATDDDAVARIVGIKGRDETKPFIVLCAAIDDLAQLGIRADASQLEALAAIWPAPLTAILPLEAPIAASRGAMSLAIRIPALAWLRELLERTGPLVSTSANRSGEKPVLAPSDLALDLQDRVDAIVDAGPSSGEASAIVDLTADEPRIVRGDSFFTQNLWKTLRKSR